MTKRVSSPDSTIAPVDVESHASTHTSSKGDEAICACGCNQPFIRDRWNQKYIAEHRFRAYESHKCPDCGSIHRVKEPRGLLGNG